MFRLAIDYHLERKIKIHINKQPNEFDYFLHIFKALFFIRSRKFTSQKNYFKQVFFLSLIFFHDLELKFFLFIFFERFFYFYEKRKKLEHSIALFVLNFFFIAYTNKKMTLSSDTFTMYHTKETRTELCNGKTICIGVTFHLNYVLLYY